jgi:hypothetical protein
MGGSCWAGLKNEVRSQREEEEEMCVAPSFFHDGSSAWVLFFPFRAVGRAYDVPITIRHHPYIINIV